MYSIVWNLGALIPPPATTLKNQLGDLKSPFIISSNFNQIVYHIKTNSNLILEKMFGKEKNALEIFLSYHIVAIRALTLPVSDP